MEQQHLMTNDERTKNTAYHATIDKATVFMKNIGNDISNSRIVRTTRDNPFPLILIGLGAGWLAYNLSGKTRRRRSTERNYQPQSENVGPKAFAGVQEKFGNMSHKVANATRSAYEGASGALNSAYENASDFANRAYTKAGEYSNQASDTYDQY